MDLQDASSFIDYDKSSGEFTINPQQSDAGTHTIQVTLTDDTRSSKVTKTIKVGEAQEEEEEEEPETEEEAKPES